MCKFPRLLGTIVGSCLGSGCCLGTGSWLVHLVLRRLGMEFMNGLKASVDFGGSACAGGICIELDRGRA